MEVEQLPWRNARPKSITYGKTWNSLLLFPIEVEKDLEEITGSVLLKKGQWI
jgi:hypothetical protein